MKLFALYLAFSELCAIWLARRWWGQLILWDMCENTEFRHIAAQHAAKSRLGT